MATWERESATRVKKHMGQQERKDVRWKAVVYRGGEARTLLLCRIWATCLTREGPHRCQMRSQASGHLHALVLVQSIS